MLHFKPSLTHFLLCNPFKCHIWVYPMLSQLGTPQGPRRCKKTSITFVHIFGDPPTFRRNESLGNNNGFRGPQIKIKCSVF